MRKTYHPVLVRTVIACIAGLVLAGCTRSVTHSSEEPSNLEAWVKEVKDRPPPPLDPLPVMQQFETFTYAAQGMRDPFSNAFADQAGAGGNPNPKRRRQALEAFPLDTLDMAGTIGGGSSLIAVVVAPDKTPYRVRPGDYMGLNNGRVTAIRKDRIELVELVPDGAGGWEEREASIALEDE